MAHDLLSVNLSSDFLACIHCVLSLGGVPLCVVVFDGMCMCVVLV